MDIVKKQPVPDRISPQLIIFGLRDPVEEKKHRIKMDMMIIGVTLLLQDVPFFCLRMILIFHFDVISHMNIFFTCKNTLVIVLQFYRLLVLVLERRPTYRRQSRILSLVHNPYDPQCSKIRKKCAIF